MAIKMQYFSFYVHHIVQKIATWNETKNDLIAYITFMFSKIFMFRFKNMFVESNSL